MLAIAVLLFVSTFPGIDGDDINLTKCPDVMPIRHGRVSYINPEPGNLSGWYEVTCDEGHVIEEGTRLRKCQESGEWAGAPPVCKKIQLCPNILGVNFGSLALQREVSQISVVTCDKGYTLDGPSTFSCINDSGVLKYDAELSSCVPYKCPYIEQYRNGYLTTEFSDELSDVVKFECDAGYGLIPRTPQWMRCRTSLDWSLPPCNCQQEECDQSKCPYLIGIEHGNPPDRSVVDARTEGTKWEFTCKPGYKLSGTATVTCTNGAWSQLPSCVDYHCQHVEHIDNGKANPTTDYTQGANITITCNSNYMPEGRVPYIVCKDREWSHPPNCVKIRCPDIELANGEIGHYSTEPGIVINYSCNTGYTLIGSATAENKCLQNGVWEHPQPTCEANRVCENLDSSSRGLYSASTNSDYAFLAADMSDGLWASDGTDNVPKYNIMLTIGAVEEISFSFLAKSVTVILLDVSDTPVSTRTFDGDPAKQTKTDLITTEFSDNVQNVQLIFKTDTDAQALLKDLRTRVCRSQ